jgi:ureidoglycolate dehydrogenase (NAD+)
LSQNKIIVGHEDLSRFIREALEGKGARPEDAAVVADGLVWANLRGVDGHGVSRLPFYLRMIERGEIDVAAKPSLAQDRAATFVLDGGRGFGPVATMHAIALATERAAKAGVCFGLVRDTTHTGAIGRYVQWMGRSAAAPQ